MPGHLPGLLSAVIGQGLLIWSSGSNRSEPEKPNGGHRTPARTASSTPADTNRKRR